GAGRTVGGGRNYPGGAPAPATRRLRISTPRGDLRSSVIERLFRCRFWKSEPRRANSASTSARASTLMTRAPMSASWRTHVGPARARVRSITEYAARGSEVMAGGEGAGRGEKKAGGGAPARRAAGPGPGGAGAGGGAGEGR